METAADIVDKDLNYICQQAGEELRAMAGRRLLITGGAGFLGHYLVQGVTHFNRNFSGGKPIDLTVVDNFSRGVPAWLTKLQSEKALRLMRHDMREPLPHDL